MLSFNGIDSEFSECNITSVTHSVLLSDLKLRISETEHKVVSLPSD